MGMSWTVYPVELADGRILYPEVEIGGACLATEEGPEIEQRLRALHAAVLEDIRPLRDELKKLEPEPEVLKQRIPSFPASLFANRSQVNALKSEISTLEMRVLRLRSDISMKCYDAGSIEPGESFEEWRENIRKSDEPLFLYPEYPEPDYTLPATCGDDNHFEKPGVIADNLINLFLSANAGSSLKEKLLAVSLRENQLPTGVSPDNSRDDWTLGDPASHCPL